MTQINRKNNVDGNNANQVARSQGRNPIPDFPFVGFNTKKRDLYPDKHIINNLGGEEEPSSESGYKSRSTYSSSPTKRVYSTQGTILPQDAYVAQDISGRGTMTKELSASKQCVT